MDRVTIWRASLSATWIEPSGLTVKAETDPKDMESERTLESGQEGQTVQLPLCLRLGPPEKCFNSPFLIVKMEGLAGSCCAR